MIAEEKRGKLLEKAVNESEMVVKCKKTECIVVIKRGNPRCELLMWRRQNQAGTEN